MSNLSLPTYLEFVLVDGYGWEVDLASGQVFDPLRAGRGSSFRTTSLGRDEVMDLLLLAKDEGWDSEELIQYLQDSEFFEWLPPVSRAS